MSVMQKIFAAVRKLSATQGKFFLDQTKLAEAAKAQRNKVLQAITAGHDRFHQTV